MKNNIFDKKKGEWDEMKQLLTHLVGAVIEHFFIAAERHDVFHFVAIFPADSYHR